MKKIYLILGASSDIGRAFMQKLEQEKQDCVIICQYYQSKSLLEEVVNHFSHVQPVLVSCNLSEHTEVEKLIHYIKDNYQCPTHILHLAASKLEYIHYKHLSWEKLIYDIEVQLHSIIEIAKVFLPLMSKLRKGKVVFMLSSCTLGVPPKFMTDYVVVKYALLGLMKSLACEYSGKGLNINGVSSNMIETRFLEKIDERMIEMIGDKTSMKRNVRIDEAVSSIYFLMSGESDYINGVNFNLTGGDFM